MPVQYMLARHMLLPHRQDCLTCIHHHTARPHFVHELSQQPSLPWAACLQDVASHKLTTVHSKVRYIFRPLRIACSCLHQLMDLPQEKTSCNCKAGCAAHMPLLSCVAAAPQQAQTYLHSPCSCYCFMGWQSSVYRYAMPIVAVQTPTVHTMNQQLLEYQRWRHGCSSTQKSAYRGSGLFRCCSRQDMRTLESPLTHVSAPPL